MDDQLGLASGAFGVSLAFIDHIAGDPPGALPFLWIGWSALIAVIISTLASFQASYRAHEIAIENIAREVSQQKPKLRPRPNRWDTLTRILNWVSMIAFFAGLIGLAVFAIMNLS